MDEEILTAIKQEIETDPNGFGYSGKTPDEIADLLNTPRVTKTPIIYHAPPPPPPEPHEGDIVGYDIVTDNARIAEILIGIPDTPNMVTGEDVQAALDALLP